MAKLVTILRPQAGGLSNSNLAGSTANSGQYKLWHHQTSCAGKAKTAQNVGHMDMDERTK